jgi:hypothetical protein
MRMTVAVALFVGSITGCAVEDAHEAGLGEDVESLATVSGPSEICADDPTSCPIANEFNDSFRVFTTDRCGLASFVDFGPGAAGGGNNDDYIVIEDLCSDGHGVRANGTLAANNVQFALGRRYNGNGAGTSVVWDPFKAIGNVLARDVITLTICLVDGANDATPSRCVTASVGIVDG